MAHFAEINDNNVVLRVIVVDNINIWDQYDNQSETVGRQYCHDHFGGTWIQTSYNGIFRDCFAGIGFTYDVVNDVFVPPSNDVSDDDTPQTV